MRRTLFLLAAVAVISPYLRAQSPAPQGVLGFYRDPAVRGSTMVFTAEGDLWTVPVTGGQARRLTSHPAEETDPSISPDGQTVAFTARYEGSAEIYTMPIAGGAPVRRTYDASSSMATSWSPDGRLLYTTLQYSGLPKPQMVQLDLKTSQRTLVPLAGATEGAYDPTGRTLFFARPAFHNNVTKRYTGGTARQIWKYADGAAEAERLTLGYRGESHSPLWWNGRVYFVTDRDGTMNLWSMDENGKDLRQHTHHSGWDVHDPDLDAGRIAYEAGADLWLFDIASGQSQKLSITIASDLDQLRERWITDPMASVTSVHLSPDGDRVVLTSRGRVFVAPAKQGRLVRATRKDNVRYRDVVFMPDGKSVLGLSDESGELEFVTVAANGVGSDHAVTHDGKVLRFRGAPSPDGKFIAYTDNNHDLWLLDVASGSQKVISQNREGVGDLAWAPGAKWLAYRMTALNTFQRIVLYNVDAGTTTPVTSDRVNSESPAWDPKGEFLYLLSDRNLQTTIGSPWGPRQPEPYFDKSDEIYQVALRPGVRSPFLPNDELHPASVPTPGSATGAASGTATRPAPAQVEPQVDLTNLAARIRRVPIPAGNYANLTVNGDALFWLSRGTSSTDLLAVKLANEKIETVTVAEGVTLGEMSLDGKRLLVRKASDLYVIDAKPAKATLPDAKVNLTGWSFSIDVRQDWRQIFTDAWRLERDYFYDPNLHGVDYRATLAKYLPLVDRVTTRDELSELIGWAVGELSALHTSVRGGDLRTGPDQVSVAALGARLLRDPSSRGYRIDYIYRTDPDRPDERSPLADPDLGIAAGDVITAVNGVSTLDAVDIGELLRNQTGKQVLLTIARAGQARDVVVVPIGNEATLRYSDWEWSRRNRVDELGKGAIGYVHLRAMGAADINQWYRDFYPVFDRQGLIIDVRQNRGGNIESFILEKLMRQAWMYWKDRASNPSWNMQYAFRGHVVVLVDSETASDGEAFAEGFKRLSLGKIIGTRTWGGEIWLSSVNTLSDGGLARAPMMGVYGPDGKWLVEQEGVIPDIEVDNPPHATFLGQDAQLDRAIRELQQEIAADPRPVPAPPPHPIKKFDYPKGR